MNIMKDSHGIEIPSQLEEHLWGFNLKVNYIYKSDPIDIVNDVFFTKQGKDSVPKQTLHYFSIPISHQRSLLVTHYENPAGEGIVSYAECLPERIATCLRAMGDNCSLADTIDALDITVAAPIFVTRNSAYRLNFEPDRKVVEGSL